MSLAGAIFRKLSPPCAPAPEAEKPPAKSTAYRYTVNLSPRRRTWLMRMKATLGRLRPWPKHQRDTAIAAHIPEAEGHKAASEHELAEFSKFLTRDQNDPLVVLWLNDAKVRQRDHGGSLRRHLFALWRERTAHAAGIAARLKVERKFVGELTGEARFYLSVVSLAAYGFFYMLAISEPSFSSEIVTIGILTSVALFVIYGLRFHLGRGPTATGNPVIWILRQLAFPFFAGGAAGIVLTALIMSGSPAYASVTDDGYGGILNLIKIFWADLAAHTRP